VSDIDWSVLEIEGVPEVAERAARRLTNEWAPTFEYEDVLQEAYLLLAAKPRQVHNALAEGGLGVLHHRLWADLTDYARAENRRTKLNVSYDALVERAGL
jgi:hypothetical protein